MIVLLVLGSILSFLALCTVVSVIFRERDVASHPKRKQTPLKVICASFNCVTCLAATAYFVLSAETAAGAEGAIFILFSTWHGAKITLYILSNFWQKNHVHTLFVSFFCMALALWSSSGISQNNRKYPFLIMSSALYLLLLMVAAARFGLAARRLVNKLLMHAVDLSPTICHHAICETLRSIHDLKHDPISRFLGHFASRKIDFGSQIYFMFG